MQSSFNLKRRIFLPILFFISTLPILAQPTVLTSDSLALVALYNSANGQNWAIRTNWLTGSVNSWFGVTVNSGRVTQLSLPSNRLIGDITPEIKNLTALTSLNLSDNSFNNRLLPIEVGNLTNLITLNLSLCSLAGAIPNQIINCNNLQSLMLQGNLFTSVPTLTALTSLSSLDISYNKLSFADIEPNVSISGIIYAPQNRLESTGPFLAFARIGEQIIFSENSVEGSSNNYEWVKDNNVIFSGITYTIAQFSEDDAGSYHLRVTSPLAPLLTLETYDRILKPAKEEYFLIDMANEILADTLRDNPYGQAWADFDLDGDEDLFYGGIDFDGNIDSNRLYENNGDGTFTSISAGELTAKKRDMRGASWGDINNDGYPDIYVSDLGYRSGAPTIQEVEVFINNKDKTFTSILLPPQVDLNNQESGSWGDYNKDGFLDLIIRGSGSANSPLTLYKNNGNNSFSIVENPFNGFVANGIGTVSWVDINGDNWPDIFYSQTGVRALFINNKDGTFSRDLSSALVTENLTSSRGHSMADIDDDGDLDVIILDQSIGTTKVFFNNGIGNFDPIASVNLFGINLKGRASSFGDIDNDGDQDFVCLCPDAETPLFLNNGNGTFTNVTKNQQSFFETDQFMTTTLSDFNNDGFLDLFYNSINYSSYLDDRPLHVLQNVSNGNNWIKIKLEGVLSNRPGIGAKIQVESNETWRTRFVEAQSGFGSQNPLTVHFGIGDAVAIDSVVITWPSGLIQKLGSLEINKLWIINEINFGKQGQTIVFDPIDDKTIGDPPFDLTATATSGLPVSFSSSSGLISLSGKSVTMLSAGRAVINADQAGNESYIEAAQVNQSFCINPSKPTVTKGPDGESVILTSSEVTGNHWFKNGTIISGETNNTLAVTTPGLYKVQITADDCASEFSNEVALIVTGDINNYNSVFNSIYPNPAFDELTISLYDFEPDSPVFIRILDMKGNVLTKVEGIGKKDSKIDVKQYSSGSYLLIAEQLSKSKSWQFIKSDKK